MGLKLFMVFFACLSGTMCGIVLSKLFKERKKYYENLLSYISYFIAEVRFSKESLTDINKKFISGNDSSFNLTLKSLNEKIAAEDTAFVLPKNCVKKSERENVENFLNTLGKYDFETQISSIEYFKDKFGEIYGDVSVKCGKFSGMVIKLGFLLGLAVGILLL